MYVRPSQPGKVANLARGQLAEQGKWIIPCPRSRLRFWSREMGSAVPSRVSLLISILQAESSACLRDSSRVPRRRPFINGTHYVLAAIHTCIHTMYGDISSTVIMHRQFDQ